MLDSNSKDPVLTSDWEESGSHKKKMHKMKSRSEAEVRYGVCIELRHTDR